MLCRASLTVFAVIALGCGSPSRPAPGARLSRFDQQITSPLQHLRMRPAQTIHLPVLVKNTGPDAWTSGGAAPVMLSYRWFLNGSMLPADGERTALPVVLRPGDSIAVEARVTTPNQTGNLVLAVSMVQEGVAWFFTSGGKPLQIPVEVVEDQSNAPLTVYADEITSSVSHLLLKPSENIMIPVTIRNTGDRSWSSVGTAPVLVSYKWFDDGRMLPVEGLRTGLPGVVRPGQSVTVPVNVQAPPGGKHLVLKISLVQEGVAWFFIKGATTLDIPVTLK